MAWPVSIDPVAWDPNAAPELVGDYAQNHVLESIEIFTPGDGIGPEDIDVDLFGRIYAPYEDGRIFRYNAQGQEGEEFANTQGHPLGIQFDANGNLIVCDAFKGLLSISSDGELNSLVTEVDGIPLTFTNDVDIAKDGTIYFTDASIKFDQPHFRDDILEHLPNGRLLAYDPKTGSTQTVKDKLYFANGVALSPDQSFILVNETSAYRITKVWIDGEKKGQSEIFMDNLPGIPDGISSNGEGVFWVAFPSKRQAIIDKLAPKPFLRKVVMRLPQSLQPAPERYGFVLGVSPEGEVLYNLHDPSPNSFSPITSVEEQDGYLYFGSLTFPGFGRMKVPI